jgi:hypothetical protein
LVYRPILNGRKSTSIFLPKIILLRLCLRVWRGGEGMVLKKRKKQVEGIEKFGREGVWRVIFSS